ncbi:MAG: pSer/pThr/pTyr-binding forkhead associated (FHA) protein [Bradymonadia bacterium]|jgi:pSer/pThr/pTyr-binding forkhead associated (FHA) protein
MAFRLHFQDLSGHSLLVHEFSEGEVTIGRSDECTVALNSGSVSRKHARFFVHLGRAYVEDLRSANGVVVNGARINGVHALAGPTMVVIGDHVVKFEPIVEAPALAQSEPIPEVAVPGWRPTLVRLESAVEERFPLIGATARIGRSSKSDIQIVDASISRMHAEVRIEADSVILVDLSSANGSLINAQSVTQPVRLTEGDILQLGDISLLFTGNPDQVDPLLVVLPKVNSTRPGDRLYLVAGALAVVVIMVAVAVIWASLSRGPSTAESLQTALSTAAAAEAAGNWDSAEAAWTSALVTAPQDATVLAGLDRARQELASQREFERCETQLDSAKALQSGEPSAAIAALVEAQTCFHAMRPESSFAARATATSRNEITPPLVELHRLAGAAAVRGGQFDAALEHLRTARRLQDARLDEGQSAQSEVVATELRSAYLTAASAAFTATDWGRAASLLTQANEIATLDATQTQQLTQARANSARTTP